MDEPPHPAGRRPERQGRSRFGFLLLGAVSSRTMRPVGKMDHDVDRHEMFRPARQRTDIAERAKLDTRDRLRRGARPAKHRMSALDQGTTQRPADEAGRPGHQNARQA